MAFLQVPGQRPELSVESAFRASDDTEFRDTPSMTLGACVYRYGPVTKSKLSYAVLGTLGIYFTVCTRTRVAYTDAQVAG